MFAKSRIFSFSAISFVMFAGAAFAQITAIEGDVKGPDGQPLKGAAILIERLDMKGTYKGAKSDKKGHYIYNGLPIGKYKVSLVVDGKTMDTVDNVSTRLGDPVPIDLDARKGAAQQQAAQQAASTGTVSKDVERGMTKEQKEAYEKKAKENAAAMAKNKALNDAFNAGKEAQAAKNFQGAVDAFQKAAELDPNQHVVWGQLAESYISLAGTKTGAESDDALNKGLDAYQKALALKPDDAGYHNNYALALVKAKKIPEAQAELAKAAELDPPGAGKYYYNLGAVLVNSGQNDAAGEAFKKAIELDPTYADAQYQYGVTLLAKATVDKEGKVVPPPGTVEALQKYLELKPDGPYAESAKGMLQTLTGSVTTTYSNPTRKSSTTPPKKK
ncbi:MAG TPA: tetratricopeptide repeat protein [Bryobacteraceae bacterium]|nr:tetratricopeptide repeat protein [Bryobacteraceae bacterium]